MEGRSVTETNSEVRVVYASSLLKKAAWNGTVCALAIVLTSLNLFPPVDVQYRVRTQVLVAQPRYEQLKSVLEKDRKAIQSGKLKYVQLFSLRKLDGSKRDDLLLVELESLWTGRASAAHIESWLVAISKAEPRNIANSEEARVGRFARWQAESAKHYLRRHLYLCSEEATDESVNRLASTVTSKSATRVPVKFASLSSPETRADPAPVSTPLAVATPEADEGSQSHELQLVNGLKKAELEQSKSEKIFQHALEKYAGAIELVGVPRIRSKTSTIPTWMSASILVLALASGSIFSLLQYRAHSGGAYDPRFVADQLAFKGLPVLDEINLSNTSSDAATSSANGIVGYLARISSRHIALASECLLGLWCFAIACRMLFDPLWRGVVFESPLAAFGRLITGLP